MRNGDAALSKVRAALEQTAIPIKIFHPTHITRSPKLLQESFDFANDGGYIDMTCGSGGEGKPSKCIIKAKEQGVDLKRITLSSDGMGSWSNYDKEGNLIKIGYSAVDTIYHEICSLVKEEGMDLSEALTFATSNTAHSLELFPRKGCVRVGADADLLLMQDDLSLDMVMAQGKMMMQDGVLLKKGTYEKD